MQVLDQERAALAAEDPTLRNRWARLGEFLGQLGASGDASQAGAIMSDLLARDRNMARDLRRETMRLTMQGFGLEDAANQALASRLSGEHQAAQATQDRTYQHNAGQADRTDRHNLAGFEASQRYSAQAQQAQIAAAEAAFAAGEHAYNRRREGLGAFAQSRDPATSRAALEAMAPEGFGEDAQMAWAGEQSRRMQEAGLQAFVQVNEGNTRELARVLGQFDRGLTRQRIERIGPAAALAQAMASPGAQEAFANNPELATYLRLQQPAQ